MVLITKMGPGMTQKLARLLGSPIYPGAVA
jgi:hypothetical protein